MRTLFDPSAAMAAALVRSAPSAEMSEATDKKNRIG